MVPFLAGRSLDSGTEHVRPKAGARAVPRARGTPIPPMLATTVSVPPSQKGYGYEFKWDGYRAVLHIEDGKVRIDSRNLLDVTDSFPLLAARAAQVAEKHLILDGEILAFDEEQRPSFGLLQQHLRRAGTPDAVGVDFFPFDVLRRGDRWLLSTPYEERRALLSSLPLDEQAWNVPAHRVDAAAPMVEASRTMGLEGVVAKRLASPYRPGERSRDWLKIKNRMRQEFVVGGWVPERGTSTNRLGSLLVGYYESKAGAQEGEPRLTYAGRVGTGFDDATQAELMARLRAAKRPASPFQAAPADADVQHVEPTLVVEVAFTEWTLTGHLRQPSFLAIRDDKDAEDVRREHPRRMPGGAS